MTTEERQLLHAMADILMVVLEDNGHNLVGGQEFGTAASKVLFAARVAAGGMVPLGGIEVPSA